jgi:hypothetical protein
MEDERLRVMWREQRHPPHVGPITGSTASQRAEWLLEVERVVAGVA